MEQRATSAVDHGAAVGVQHLAGKLRALATGEKHVRGANLRCVQGDCWVEVLVHTSVQGWARWPMVGAFKLLSSISLSNEAYHRLCVMQVDGQWICG